MTLRLEEAENVSQIWLWFHCLTLSCVALFGITAGIMISILYKDNDFLCGIPVFDSSENHERFYGNTTNQAVQIWFSSAQANNACEFTQYTMITSFIFALIWVVFFFICGPGGKSQSGLPQPWRIVFLALVFNVIFFCISLGAGIQITTTAQTFCSNYNKVFAEHFNVTVEWRCYKLNQHFKYVDMENIDVELLITLSELDVWLCTVAWGASVIVCIFRICLGPDFIKPNNTSTTTSTLNKRNQKYEELINSPISPVSPTTDLAGSSGTANVSVVTIHEPPRLTEPVTTHQSQTIATVVERLANEQNS